MYNLQSGQHRRRFPTRLTPAEARKLRLQQLEAEDAIVPIASDSSPQFTKGQGKHKGAVTGLAVDSLNRLLISCGDDGKVKVKSTHILQQNVIVTFAAVLGLRLRSTPPRAGLVPNDSASWSALPPCKRPRCLEL
jgi:U3 small nucleolar RNA-associated protein 21